MEEGTQEPKRLASDVLRPASRSGCANGSCLPKEMRRHQAVSRRSGTEAPALARKRPATTVRTPPAPRAARAARRPRHAPMPRARTRSARGGCPRLGLGLGPVGGLGLLGLGGELLLQLVQEIDQPLLRHLQVCVYIFT